jgi:Uma2 family endonuclease
MSTGTTVPFTPTHVRVPQPKRWTVAEFHRICCEPVYENRRMILIEGEIFEMPKPNPPHDVAIGLAEQALRTAFGAGFWVRGQMALVLGLSTDPMPDLAVVTGSPRDYASVHPVTASLVVEISESTLAFDTGVKSNIYAAGGIQDYWVVDLVHRSLIVFRDPANDPTQPHGAFYRTHQSLDASASIRSLAAPNSTIAVSSLLP